MNIIDTSEGKIMKQKKTRTERKTQSPFRLNKARHMLQLHLPELREHYRVQTLWIFGSHVRGEQDKKSDLDILVEFEKAPSLFEFVRLERYLSEILKIKVDLVMKSALKPVIGRHIVEEAQPI
jgi:predicted nucleotidyltransferase